MPLNVVLIEDIDRVTLSEGNTVLASVGCQDPVKVMNSFIRFYDPFQKWNDAEAERKGWRNGY